MSLETLAIMNNHRDSQIEDGPFSEEFTIVGGASFFGIFNEAHREENKDRGGVYRKDKVPSIMVSTVPDGLVERSTQISRESGEVYLFSFVGRDDPGVPILWLSTIRQSV